ncbi:MAG: F0F1 ATP synthase subunit A [Lachnospiraceae bacterium]|nr:F0F1 ATP synthase subunit A [Lachnospiraceae bacterium]MCR5778062.1 F0F1 ATP synthase subunit A [Lachnospiraceae bacterium]
MGERLVEELGVKNVTIGSFVISESIVNTWILMAIILVVCLLLTRNLSVDNPSKTQVAVESFVTWIQGMVRDMLGEHAAKYTDYICTVLVFIALSDLSAIFETETEFLTFFKPATKDLNVTAALALMTITLVIYTGITSKGVGGWMKSFTMPMAIVTPLNIIEVFTKPLSLCMRLFGNIFGGFVIMALIKMIMPIILPIPFSFYFDVFDGLIQAYVFVFLTCIYLSEAAEVEVE